MIRNFKLKLEEKHMESLYCLLNINTERKYGQKYKIVWYLVTFIPLAFGSGNTKSRVWHRSPLWYEIYLSGASTSFMNI